VAGLATLSAVAGIFLGWAIFIKRLVSPSLFREKLPWAYDLLSNKYYFDEIYWAILVKPLFWVTDMLSGFDQHVVDGFVNGVAKVTYGIAIVQAWIDKWIVDGLVNLVGGVTKYCGQLLKYAQTGVLQNYALLMFLCILVIAWAYLFR
jgi:NADH-quinone oxidoreductase subunit L